MAILFVSIIAPVISGCIVAIFTFWLNNRNKSGDIAAPKNPLTISGSEGIGVPMKFSLLSIVYHYIGRKCKSMLLKILRHSLFLQLIC
ncbi:type I toxin-antitoxin system Fst family toxin [Staphylococcus aureus]|nr:type I toxin-antitoxin system Fst family toxin [Staphylococcus aureus]